MIEQDFDAIASTLFINDLVDAVNKSGWLECTMRTFPETVPCTVNLRPAWVKGTKGEGEVCVEIDRNSGICCLKSATQLG